MRQGGISPSAPPKLASQLLRLPPILHKRNPHPVPNYSKAPRGLFVLLRVHGIFTACSISPGPSLRQCSSCYTFRAGRNLPDKEFRYLRTVIVTAAVHRGFSSELRFRLPLPLTFRHWAGVSPYTAASALAETCGFGNQSLEPFLCDPQRLPMLIAHPQRRPFSRSYGANLPNSLTRVLPFALVSSTCPPVSVCGTDARTSSLRGFSWQLSPVTSCLRHAITPRTPETALPVSFFVLHAWHRDFHPPADFPCCVPPSLPPDGSGILTGCPSPTPFGLGLGPTHPTGIALPSEPLGFRRTRFSRVSRYSCQHSHSCALHRSFRYGFSAHRTLPYPMLPHSHGFGKVL